ncbi:cholecystokinin receptor type A-like [Mercenaria mercenaria]|uniref:cholecystokinin receptor type A-like n=1 Tax=Mercenaria mercenaria TaxID=6596 RepID=UPI00234F563E|nr:cholecystokinin receptor type A-like [Mercenaria mercenaria]
MERISYENDTLLDQSQREVFLHLLPVIVCMAVVGIVGILGNILTIIFYAFKQKRSPSTIQIACLAAVDLMVCIMIIPNIIEMVVNVKFNQSFMCKFTHFLGLWTIASSCLILWIIALDRHRKICKPFAKQTTVRSTEYAITGIVVFSFFLSVRNFANFDSIKIDVPVTGTNRTISGQYCTTRDDSGYKISVSIFHSIDFVLLLMVWVTVIVTYTRVIYTLFRLRRTRKREIPSVHIEQSSHVKLNRRDETKDNVELHELKSQSDTQDSDTSELKYPADTLSSSTEFSTGDMTTLHSYSHSPAVSTATGKNHSHVVPSVSGGTFSHHSLRRTVCKLNTRKRKRRHKIAARSASERNLTYMMLTVSVLFILCFFPYFVIKIIMRLVLKSGEEFELAVGTQFALRLVYFNSVFNPVIYCFFNPQFRRYIKYTLLKCFQCAQNKMSSDS